jgi:inosine-uridine nucleoside N-ribohydrolase
MAMSPKAVVIADPGIDTAFAIALALNDSEVELVGLMASAGNVAPDQATQNVRIILEQLDPPRLPRLGAALPIPAEFDGSRLHGPGGLGGATFPVAKRDDPPAADKVLVELIRESPHQVTIIAMGPLTDLARAIDRDPEIVGLIKRIVCLGGVWRETGDVGPVAEFHMACDPLAARQVLRCGAPITLIPLDVSRQLVFSPSDLLELPEPEARTCQFLRQIVPFGIRATANLYGVEGFHLCDVLGVMALTRPTALTLRPAAADVETRGELTRGMCVIDARAPAAERANVDLATAVDVPAARMYIKDVLGSSI